MKPNKEFKISEEDLIFSVEEFKLLQAKLTDLSDRVKAQHTNSEKLNKVSIKSYQAILALIEAEEHIC
jgi:hypothetical protein